MPDLKIEAISLYSFKSVSGLSETTLDALSTWELKEALQPLQKDILKIEQCFKYVSLKSGLGISVQRCFLLSVN